MVAEASHTPASASPNSIAIAVPEGVKLPIFMDNHSTTAVDLRVVQAMLPFFTQHYGNAASRNHSFGWTAEAAVENARAQVAALLGGDAKEIVWTSGATEANNLAIKGAASYLRRQGNHIITVETEHKCVLDTCKRLQRDGFEVTYLTPAKDGLVTPEQVTAAMTDKTILVSIMLANNEIGVIQPIEAIGAAIKAKNPGRCSTPTPSRASARCRSTSRRPGSIWRRSPRTSCTGPRASARCGCAASPASGSIRSSTAAATSAACGRARCRCR